MYYVYLIQSISTPDRTYIGLTNDLKNRLLNHNAGEARHTVKYRPWKIVTYIGFTNKQRAVDFERYLKTHSGRSFASKRLW